MTREGPETDKERGEGGGGRSRQAESKKGEIKSRKRSSLLLTLHPQPFSKPSTDAPTFIHLGWIFGLGDMIAIAELTACCKGIAEIVGVEYP